MIIENILDKTISLYNKNKYSDIIDLLKSFIDESNEYKLIFFYGLSLIKKNDDLGIVYLLKSLNLSPNDKNILREVCLFYLEKKNFELAEFYVNKLMLIESDNMNNILLKSNIIRIKNLQETEDFLRNKEYDNDKELILLKCKVGILIELGIYDKYNTFDDKNEFWHLYFISKNIDNNKIDKLLSFALFIFDDNSIEESLLILEYINLLDFDFKDRFYQVLACIFIKVGDTKKEVENIIKSLDININNINFLKNLLASYYYENYGINDYKNYCQILNSQYKEKNIYKNFLNKKNKKIRIGYVSADFYKHSIMYFIPLIYRNHNKNEFEVFSYYLNNKENTILFKDLSKKWRDVSDLNEKEIADIIYKDKIDILVDLTGLFEFNKSEIFAYKPAPVQLSMIGYFGTLGLDTVDYKILDKYLSENIEDYFFEKIINIPETMYCYDAPENIPDITELPYLKNKYLTFGSFNIGSKISETTIKFWSKILNKYNNSKMIIKCQHSQYSIFRERVLNSFKINNIDSSRIVFYKQIKKSYDHLEFYNNIDISLDTYPYNGVTTTFESLVMGVPVLSLTGNILSSRACRSILNNLGLNDWIIDELEKDINIDIDKLVFLRKNLREKLLSSVLCDHKGFTLKLENIYKQILRR